MDNNNNPLQNNDSYSEISQPLQMDQPLSNNTFYNNNVNSSCNYADFSVTSNNIIPTSYSASNYEQQQSTFSSVNNENVTSATQSSSYAPPQYTSSHVSLPLNSPNMITTNPSQTNHSEILRFEIPGFKIIIIPTSSPTPPLYGNLNNLDTQNQFQQDYASSNVVADNSNPQIQFNNFRN